MKLTNSIQASAFLMIFLNLAMAFICIWGFTRMTPTLELLDTEKTDTQLLTTQINELVIHFDDYIAGNKTISIEMLDELKKMNADIQDQIKTVSELRRQTQTSAWMIVFLTFLFFLYGLTFLRQINNRLILPITKIGEVLRERLNGNPFRRCPEKGRDSDIQQIYNDLNSILDRKK